MQFERTTQLAKYTVISKADLLREIVFIFKVKTWQRCFPIVNKLLMIKQIQNVRKEFSAFLMTGAAYQIFMSYEAARLVSLFHLQVI